MSTTLNVQEKRVFDYIKEQIREKGYPPSVREICAALGFKSTSSAHQYISISAVEPSFPC